MESKNNKLLQALERNGAHKISGRKILWEKQKLRRQNVKKR
jgi:hypothetical protein